MLLLATFQSKHGMATLDQSVLASSLSSGCMICKSLCFFFPPAVALINVASIK